MRIPTLLIAMLTVTCLLAFFQEAKAAETYGNSTVTYDSATNTVSGYSCTNPDYTTMALYYTIGVSSSITDINGNTIASRQAQTAYGKAEVTYSGSGNGSSKYNISSGHWMFLQSRYSYCGGNSSFYGAADTLNYSFYEGQGATGYIFLAFYGNGPERCFYGDTFMFLGTTQQSVCVVPTGETTTSGGWADAQNLPTVHRWNQTLLPTATNFSGRTVTEENPGGTNDSCWFSGSAIGPAQITGGNWPVGGNNEWGPDFVGWTPFGVNYYRGQGRAPCSAIFPQRMVIDCGAGTQAYVTNTLEIGIGITLVTSRRAEGQDSRSWP